MATSLDVLNRCGLTKAVADITKNAKLQAKVLEMLALSGVEADGCSPAVGMLLYGAASRIKESSERFRPILGRYIVSGALKSNPQVGCPAVGAMEGAEERPRGLLSACGSPFSPACAPARPHSPCPPLQLEAALEFFKKLAGDAALDEKAFEAACGVGVDVSREEIVAAVTAEAEKNNARPEEERYPFTVGNLLVCYAAVAVAAPRVGGTVRI